MREIMKLNLEHWLTDRVKAKPIRILLKCNSHQSTYISGLFCVRSCTIIYVCN